MASVTNDEITALAALSAITLSDEETTDLRQDIENILGYVQLLGELDTSSVEPTYQVTDLENISRPDAVIDYNLSREELLALAPSSENNYVKVPKVLER